MTSFSCLLGIACEMPPLEKTGRRADSCRSAEHLIVQPVESERSQALCSLESSYPGRDLGCRVVYSLQRSSGQIRCRVRRISFAVGGADTDCAYVFHLRRTDLETSTNRVIALHDDAVRCVKYLDSHSEEQHAASHDDSNAVYLLCRLPCFCRLGQDVAHT